MVKFLTALALPAIALAAAIPGDLSVQIVGGTEASAGEFPYIVSLQSSSGSHFCGGTLVNANTVVTAAHCSTGQSPSAVRIRAGSLNRSSGGVTSGVSSIRVNPSYNSRTYDGDVAIWKLSTSIPTSSTIGYATLAAAGSDPAAGTTLTVAGWGTTSSGGQSLPTTLRKVDVPTVARTTCNSNYNGQITSNMVCAAFTSGGRDSCQGDSGGPLVDAATRVLVGIVSWGEGCAVAGKPGVYARVGSLRTFINQNL